MRYVRGWICDACKYFVAVRPWECPGCQKEICDNCGWMHGHCKACAEGKTESDLAAAANATGNFDFELPCAPQIQEVG